jgi:hypothetical protein
MIRFSVFYPATEGATFDHAYDTEKHVPLALKTWGMDNAVFDSMEAMGAAMSVPGTADVMADMANYTTITPVTQTSEVVS